MRAWCATVAGVLIGLALLHGCGGAVSVVFVLATGLIGSGCVATLLTAALLPETPCGGWVEWLVFCPLLTLVWGAFLLALFCFADISLLWSLGCPTFS